MINLRQPGFTFITAYPGADFSMITGIAIAVYQNNPPVRDLNKLAVTFTKTYECFTGLESPINTCLNGNGDFVSDAPRAARFSFVSHHLLYR